jgi:hypothetical protein
LLGLAALLAASMFAERFPFRSKEPTQAASSPLRLRRRDHGAVRLGSGALLAAIGTFTQLCNAARSSA